MLNERQFYLFGQMQTSKTVVDHTLILPPLVSVPWINHLESGAGIRTYDHFNTILLSWPLDGFDVWKFLEWTFVQVWCISEAPNFLLT